MRPSVKYVDLGSEGKAPKISHKIGVDVDNTKFIGEGASKKIARKNAAIQACNTLFNVGYTME